MNRSAQASNHPTAGSGWGQALLWTLPMALLTTVLLSGGAPGRNGPHGWLQLAPLVINWLLVNSLFFLMVRTGKTDRYRAVLFVTMAGCFVVSFISNLIEMRGSMSLSEEEMIQGKTPFCHIVIPMTLIPAALTRTIIFPGSILEGFAAIATMFTIWIGASLVMGRGWCSWGCFFGGIEDGFSRLRRHAVIKNIAHRWTYLPYAVLLVAVLTSAASLSPTYCEWFCPFKTVTEYARVDSLTRIVQTAIFVSLFAGLVVVLPILTKRRTQCGLFCPFGAFQSAANYVSPVDVRIDPDLCTGCERCATTCPTFSLSRLSIAAGRPRASCSRCGKCADACPKGAITYHVKGTPPGSRPRAARLLFLFPAFLFLATFSAGSIQDTVRRVYLLVTTGSLLR
jgi:ferredoxin-type protein NapH